MKTTLEKFQTAHDDAMREINDTVSQDNEFAQVVRYLLETDANPYSYLPEQWASCMSTATGFVVLISNIHHSLYDDGDISFPVVNGEPKISFYWKNEDNYNHLVLNDTQKHSKEHFGHEYDVKQLSTILEFIEAHKEYHRKDILRCFIHDAAMTSVEFASEHYSKYANFSYEWEDDEEILAKIEELRNKRKKVGLA